MQEQQMMLLAQLKRQLAPCPARPEQAHHHARTPQAREEKRRQLIKLLAEIERRINEENARPKKRYISPATREEVYAIYYDRPAPQDRRQRARRTFLSWRATSSMAS